MDKEIVYRKKISDAGQRQGWWHSDGIVAALSGGGDSVALLWLLKRYFPGRIVAAHLDHCTRNGASHDDAAFAQALCAEWNIKCAVKVVDVHGRREQGESFEMAGRRERYLHFRETAAAEGIEWIALGHSADDLVETQLMNLFRGTGLKGLRGIPEQRGNIVRPIINFRRDELRGILRDNNISWCEDASNNEMIYQRNKVREELIPWIKNNLNINFEESMAGLAQQLNEEIAEREEAAKKLLAEVSFVLEPALVAWNAHTVKNISRKDLIDMLRMQGELLSLPSLSRSRTYLLADLISHGGAWRFQWALDIEVCYSNRGIGWLHRCDVEHSRGKNKQNTAQLQLPWWAR